MKYPTVTIGIPAYNEEANVGYLLNDLANQKSNGFKIQEIIISSDGSTDQTKSIVKAFTKHKVTFIDNRERQGQAARQNQIIKRTKSDILVLLNADLHIPDTSFISKLIHPIINGTADLTSSSMLSVGSRTLIGKILDQSLEIKDYMFAVYKNGNNIYACHGAARALSKKMFQQFQFRQSIGEDAYSYLYTKQNGLNFKLVKSAIAYIKPPDSITDHKKQSFRNIQTIAQLQQEFGKELIAIEYGGAGVFFGMPLIIVLKGILHGLKKSPVLTIFYLFLTIWMQLESRFSKEETATWVISNSSKTLHHKKIVENNYIDSPQIKIRRVVYKLIGLFDKIFKIKRPNIIILCYHSISDDDFRFSVSRESFEKQIKILLNEYSPLTLRQLNQSLESKIQLTGKHFILTFDDGYKDILSVTDYLAKLNIQPTVFVLAEPEKANWQELGCKKEFLINTDLNKLKQLGWDIGCHSATHPDFSHLSASEVNREIEYAKQKIEKSLGTEVTFFAFPKGDYNQSILAKVKSAGYKLALTMDDTFINNSTNKYRLPRIGIDRSHDLSEFSNIYSTSVIALRNLFKRFNLQKVIL